MAHGESCCLLGRKSLFELTAENFKKVKIFIEYVNKGKGAANFMFKPEGSGTSSILLTDGYKRGYFYIDTCENQDIKSPKVYTAKIEANRKKPDLYNIYELKEFSGTQEPFICEDHGTVTLSEYNDYAFVSSSSLMEQNAFISAELVKQYDLEDDEKIYYEKAMSWDKKKNRVSWTVTKLIDVKGR